MPGTRRLSWGWGQVPGHRGPLEASCRGPGLRGWGRRGSGSLLPPGPLVARGLCCEPGVARGGDSACRGPGRPQARGPITACRLEKGDGVCRPHWTGWAPHSLVPGRATFGPAPPTGLDGGGVLPRSPSSPLRPPSGSLLLRVAPGRLFPPFLPSVVTAAPSPPHRGTSSRPRAPLRRGPGLGLHPAPLTRSLFPLGAGRPGS